MKYPACRKNVTRTAISLTKKKTKYHSYDVSVKKHNTKGQNITHTTCFTSQKGSHNDQQFNREETQQQRQHRNDFKVFRFQRLFLFFLFFLTFS